MNSTKIITAVIHQELVQAPAALQWIIVVHTLLQGLMHTVIPAYKVDVTRPNNRADGSFQHFPT